SRALPEAKQEAWQALYRQRSVPDVSLSLMIQAFWRPEQHDVLLPFTRRYLEEIPKLAGGGMLKAFGLIHGMFPDVGDQGFLEAATTMARTDGTDPIIRAALLSGSDTLVRKLRARGELNTAYPLDPRSPCFVAASDEGSSLHPRRVHRGHRLGAAVKGANL